MLCQGCGLGRVYPLPTDEAIAGFYRDQYRQEYKGSFEPKPYHVLRAGRVARERLTLLERWLRPRSMVLDIGCGGGELVYLLQRRGHCAQGHEPDVRYAAYARRELGIAVTTGPWSEIRLTPETRPDLVTLFHVLEHLAHPVEALAEIRGWLAEGGHVVVEVPNLEFPATLSRHRFHRAHLYHFNARTLPAAGERAGLQLIECSASADRGNLIAVFGVGPTPAVSFAGIPGNSDRVLDCERRRDARSYWLAPGTWRRTAGRLSHQIGERWRARAYPNRRAILDLLTA